MQKIVLWYKQPASVWEEALPVGNGKLGGMVFGDTQRERIALNEDSVWYGGPRDRNNPDALPHLEQIRGLLKEGRLREAHTLSAMALSGVPETQRHYMPLGDLQLSFRYGNESEAKDYTRELDLLSGIATVTYSKGGTVYSRETFASFPDEALVTRLTADKPGSISFTARLLRGSNRYYDELVKADESTILMRGVMRRLRRLGFSNGIACGCGRRLCDDYRRASRRRGSRQRDAAADGCHVVSPFRSGGLRLQHGRECSQSRL